MSFEQFVLLNEEISSSDYPSFSVAGQWVYLAKTFQKMRWVEAFSAKRVSSTMDQPMRLFTVLIASLLSPLAVKAAPLHYVYKGAGCAGLAELPVYEAFLGRKVDGVSDFLDWTADWPHAVVAANWLLGCWQGRVPNIDLSIPMAVRQNSGSPLHEIASGADNAYFTQIAEALVSHGFPNAYVRVGEEFNGGWYPWSAKNSPTLWIRGYQQVVTAMRAVKGANFRFIWNTSPGMGQMDPGVAYPGDAFVDVIATDAYNASWNSAHGNNKEPGLWNAVYNDPWWVKTIVTFAAKHEKPYAFPEWGTGERGDRHGGGDDPTFMTNMIPIVQGALFESYWDFNAGDYNAQLTDGTHPLSAAVFSKAFSSPGSPITKNGTPYTELVPLKVTCAECHASAVQTGPGHWNILVWALAAHPSATVSWDFKAASAEVYDPIGKAASPLKIMHNVDASTFVLEPHRPLIVAVSR